MKIYNGDLNDKYNIESYSYLQLNNCGISNSSVDNMTFRKKGRDDYHILYVKNGCCKAEFENKKYNLFKGMFILYPPETPHKYVYCKDSEALWIHFNGFNVPEILNEAKLLPGVHLVTVPHLIEKTLLDLIAEHNLQTEISEEKGILLSFLYKLGKYTNKNEKTSDVIKKCISYVTTNYNKEITSKELSTLCNLSTSRFLHLFKEYAGISPKAYQQSLRINFSKSLLVSTNLTISEISLSVGYADALYFSKIFKNTVKMSPTEYRKKYNDK